MIIEVVVPDNALINTDYPSEGNKMPIPLSKIKAAAEEISERLGDKLVFYVTEAVYGPFGKDRKRTWIIKLIRDTEHYTEYCTGLREFGVVIKTN